MDSNRPRGHEPNPGRQSLLSNDSKPRNGIISEQKDKNPEPIQS